MTGSDFLLPAGTITLLLADLESSVRHWQEDPDRMRTAVSRQDAIVEEAIARHRGVRPKDQGVGDSFFAAFSRASDALECALDIQLSFAKEDWGGTDLKLRMGLHTGEVQHHDEGNYVGATVNRCARLRGIGHGGQILLSRSTWDLVLDRLPAGTWTEDLGVQRLRDLTRPEHVYQVCHPDLQTEFPSLRSLDALPNNLPAQLSSFVGRESEIEALVVLLKGSRLLTLTGSGGCGKTRLALQVGAEVMDLFQDGVWWVDLSELADPDRVANATAQAMSVMEIDSRSMIDTLSRFIAQQSMLLILDNCEHLVNGCALLAEQLLKNCPSLTILTTSREQLGVAGETAWRVLGRGIQ